MEQSLAHMASNQEVRIQSAFVLAVFFFFFFFYIDENIQQYKKSDFENNKR